MTIVRDFVAELGSVTEVSTAVGTRIHPLTDLGMALPSIVYNIRGGARESYVQNSFGLRETFIQLDVYTDSYSQLDSLRDAIISHFNGFTGQFNSSTQVSSCKVITTRELNDSRNSRVFRGIIELNILSE